MASATAEELLMFFEEEEIIIASRYEIPVRKAPAIATVITQKEIRNMGARNLRDILRRVPGIGISIADFPVFHAVEMRGIRSTFSEKILVMVDGLRVNDLENGSGVVNFDSSFVENIKRVEIIRGPGSALYGANAFLAVVNIVTKSAEDISGVQVTAGGGSFDTQHYNLLFGNADSEVKVTAHADYLDTGGASSRVEQDAIGASGETLKWQKKYDVGFGLSFKDVTFRMRYQDNTMGPYIGTAHALNDETSVKYGTGGYADLLYDTNLTNAATFTARFYGNYFHFDNYFEIFPEGFPGYPEGMIGNPTMKMRVLGGDITAGYQVRDHQLTAGVMYENDRQYDVRHITNFDPNTFAPLGPVQDISDWANFNREVDRDIWAVYAQDVWSITDRASLTAGVRYDHYSDFGGTTNPRAGFVWEFMENTSLKLLYGSAFRAPGTAELYIMNNPALSGNPELRPEKIQTYEAGLEYGFLEKYTLRATYFFNDITDLIVAGEKPSPTEPALYENRGSAEVQGVETEFLFDFGSDNYGYVNYSYQHPKDAKTGERLPDVPSHRVNAGLNIAPWKYLNANVSASWIGERPRAKADARDDLEAMTLVNLTLIAKNLYKSLEIRGSVYNLFDEDYRDPDPFPGQVPNDYPVNERMFMLEARYSF